MSDHRCLILVCPASHFDLLLLHANGKDGGRSRKPSRVCHKTPAWTYNEAGGGVCFFGVLDLLMLLSFHWKPKSSKVSALTCVILTCIAFTLSVPNHHPLPPAPPSLSFSVAYSISLFLFPSSLPVLLCFCQRST